MPTLADLQRPNLAALAPFLAQLAGANPLQMAPGRMGANVPDYQASTTPNPRGLAPQGAASLGDLAPVSNSSPQPLPSAPRTLSLADLQNLPQGDMRKRPDWGKILGSFAGVAGDALMAYGGLAPQYGPGLARQADEQRTQQFDLDKLNRELEAKRDDALRPRMEQVGNTIGLLDPRAQTYDPTYTAPGPAEQYASALGFDPGSDDYKHAVQDYRLGSYSDPAMQNRLSLEDVRYQNRDALQGERLGVARRGQDLRYRSTTRGQDLTHGDREAATAQSNTNNIRTTGTSAANNAATNQMRFQTSKKPRGAPVEVGTPEEARKLAPGTFFKTPDGRILQR